jgi:peptide/nickel transport system substrate-binding protein
VRLPVLASTSHKQDESEETDMDRESRRRLEAYRRNEAGPFEHGLIDDWLAGEFDRREMIRRAGVLGISASTVGLLLGAAGEAAPAFAATGRAAASNARLRMGIIPPPTGAIEPHTFIDQGGLETGSICGEFLTRVVNSKTLVPELAVSWKTNPQASIWTFKLRPGVKFHTGQPMTADDVVTTWKRLASPGSQALSAVGSYLGPGGVHKVDNMTVAFHLNQPVSNFPYLVSSTTYQAIILPANYQLGTFTSKAQTTGAYMITGYTPGVGAKYERFNGWWGGTAPLAGVDVTYYQAAAAADAALLGNQIDLIGQIQLATDRALFNNSSVQIFKAEGATHREMPMRVDDNNPLSDYRVRQAVALTLDRPAIIKTLFNNLAVIGNDTPFPPVFGLAKSVPQRKQNIALAKHLMAQAGHAKGFAITLTTETTGEIPELAQIVKQSVAKIGINMTLNVETSTAYFAGSQTGPPKGWGNTPWLNAPINITDWGGRSVPNVYLVSTLQTKGVWNASHYSNPKFDNLVRKYLSSTTFKGQNAAAVAMSAILLHDTPVVFPYFYFYLAAGSKRVKGYLADPQGGVYLSKTSLA